MDSKLQQEPTEKLIELALKTESDDIADKCIVVLKYRGTKEVLSQAKQLTQSKNLTEKFIGINILGELGIPERTFPNECLNILLNLLKLETNPEVLGSVGIGLGHLGDPRAVNPLIEFKNHSHSDVRDGVVFGLLTHEDPAAIATLIELSSDRDEDVRNWATFGLGSMIETDTKEIRESLWKRLCEEKKDTETSYEIFCEALVGLATRKDLTILEILLTELESDEVWSMAVEAAEELYPALINEFKKHPDPDFRGGVVFDLLTQGYPAAIAALIELSSDRDENVRNWATFGLGSQIETDTKEIRESLWKRLREEQKDTETSYEIFWEALVGLATRKDLTILDILLEELRLKRVDELVIEAAEGLGNLKLYPALIELKKWWNVDEELLARAIKSCCPD